MRKFLGAVALVALFPLAASAVIRVNVGQTGLEVVGADALATVEVWAENTDPAQDERLNAFTIELNGPDFTPGGVRFVIPPPDPASGWIPFAVPNEHPYVFGAFAGNHPEDPSAGSNYNTVRLSGVLETTDSVDLTPSLNGFGRFQVLFPGGTPDGAYPIVFNPVPLSFGNFSATPVEVLGVPGTVTPEPSALAALALGACWRCAAGGRGENSAKCGTARRS